MWGKVCHSQLVLFIITSSKKSQVVKTSWWNRWTRLSVTLKTFLSTFKTLRRPCTIAWWSPNVRPPSITHSRPTKPSPDDHSDSSSILITKTLWVYRKQGIFAMVKWCALCDCSGNDQRCVTFLPLNFTWILDNDKWLKFCSFFRMEMFGRTPFTTTPSPSTNPMKAWMEKPFSSTSSLLPW